MSYQLVAWTTPDGIRLIPSMRSEMEIPYLKKIHRCRMAPFYEEGDCGSAYTFRLSRAIEAYSDFLGFTGERMKQLKVLMSATRNCLGTDEWIDDGTRCILGGGVQEEFYRLYEKCQKLCLLHPHLAPFFRHDTLIQEFFTESR